jgi:hypothetical protein
MRVRVLFALAVVTATIVVAPARAQLPKADPSTGVSSDNVEHIATIPVPGGAPSGARLVGHYLYVAGPTGFAIYDVADPVNPALQSFTPTGFQLFSEDVDTNGKVLLLVDEQGPRGGLYIYDVEDKSAPTLAGTVPDLREHTFTCVLGCRWAWGSRGIIVDLKDPSAPRVAGNWTAPLPGSDGFDVTEVAPGRVLTASRVIRYMDARKQPTAPLELASGTTDDFRLIHSNRWPNLGRDRFFLVQGETPFSGPCTEDSGAFMTWDASRWKKTHSFHLIDEFRVKNGNFVDGDPPANAAGCTNMWFQEHPSFDNGGLVASAFFEHGTRILDVSDEGQIKQVGYFTPAGGETIASYWLSNEIVYSVDLTRGIDILRFSAN